MMGRGCLFRYTVSTMGRLRIHHAPRSSPYPSQSAGRGCGGDLRYGHRAGHLCAGGCMSVHAQPNPTHPHTSHTPTSIPRPNLMAPIPTPHQTSPHPISPHPTSSTLTPRPHTGRVCHHVRPRAAAALHHHPARPRAAAAARRAGGRRRRGARLARPLPPLQPAARLRRRQQ